jgi:hypothetical protein
LVTEGGRLSGDQWGSLMWGEEGKWGPGVRGRSKIHR